METGHPWNHTIHPSTSPAAAARSSSQRLAAPEALRYDVEAGSPLYAEVFRRLVQNEGLGAVLDLETWWSLVLGMGWEVG